MVGQGQSPEPPFVVGQWSVTIRTSLADVPNDLLLFLHLGELPHGLELFTGQPLLLPELFFGAPELLLELLQDVPAERFRFVRVRDKERAVASQTQSTAKQNRKHKHPHTACTSVGEETARKLKMIQHETKRDRKQKIAANGSTNGWTTSQ